MRIDRRIWILGAGLAVIAGAVALPAPAQAVSSCRSIGIAPSYYSVTYDAVAADGTTASSSNLKTVAAAGSTVTAHVTILALPGESCIDLGLATYRSNSKVFDPTVYQLLYRSASATNVHVGETVDLTVLIPQTPGTPGPGCTNTHSLLQNGSGANVPGPYDTTCDGTASGNGVGDGNAKGKACAGCVGNADNKNPPGQLPGPQDNNAGYECDRNQGIAQGNPAHSGCTVGGFWQIDLFGGAEPLPYVGTPPGGGTPLSYGSIPGSPIRLLQSANG